MNDPFMTHKKVYSFNELVEEDIKLLCFALQKVSGDLDQPSLDRAVKLINAFRYALPSTDSEVDEDND